MARKAKGAPAKAGKGNGANLGFEQKLWAAADGLNKSWAAESWPPEG